MTIHALCVCERKILIAPKFIVYEVVSDVG